MNEISKERIYQMFDQTENEIVEQENKIKKKNKEIEKKNKEIEKKKNEIEETRNDIKPVQRQKEDLKIEIKDLRAKIRADERNNKSQDELDEELEELVTLLSESEKSETSLVELKEDLEYELGALINKLARLNNDLRELRDEEEKWTDILGLVLQKSARQRNAQAQKMQNLADSPPEMKPLEKAFLATFEGEQGMAGYIKKRLDEYMSQCASNWKNYNALGVYAPFCVITQSSGYGKSRMFYELAQKRIITYICLRGSLENGYPRRSSLACFFEPDILANQKRAKSLIYCLINKALDDVKNMLGKNQLNNETIVEQVAQAYREKQPWRSIEEEWQYMQQNLFKEYSDDDIKNLRIKFEEIMNDQPFFIVIDEAHYLFTRSEKSQFRLLQETLLNSFAMFRIAIVLVSTKSSIGNYELVPHQYSSSLRDLNKHSNIPFTWFIQTDGSSLVEKYMNDLSIIYETHIAQRSNQSSSTKRSKHEIYEWFKKLSPESSFFLFGRPLWASYYNTQREYMIEVARTKLLHPDSFKGGYLLDNAFKYFNCNSLAVVASRTDFLIHRINPSYMTGCELVDKCMATLIDMDNKTGQIWLRYVSEPILANAGAYYMTRYLDQVLEGFLQYLNRNAIMSSGELGELAAQLIILMAKDQAAIEKYPGDMLQHAQVLTVDEFLTSLLGSNYDKTVRDAIHTKLRQGLVLFSHFTKKVDDLSMKDVMYDFLGRNAAGLFKDNFPGCDIFICVILESEPWIGMILIQVENTVKSFSQFDLESLYEKADPKVLEENMNFPFDASNTVCFIMDLVDQSSKHEKEVDDKSINSGNESADIKSKELDKPIVEQIRSNKPGMNHVCFVVRGCGTDVYQCLDQSNSEFINQMINISRDPLRKYSRFTQKAGFSGSRSKESQEAISLEASLNELTRTGQKRSLKTKLSGLI